MHTQVEAEMGQLLKQTAVDADTPVKTAAPSAPETRMLLRLALLSNGKQAGMARGNDAPAGTHVAIATGAGRVALAVAQGRDPAAGQDAHDYLGEAARGVVQDLNAAS